MNRSPLVSTRPRRLPTSPVRPIPRTARGRDRGRTARGRYDRRRREPPPPVRQEDRSTRPGARLPWLPGPSPTGRRARARWTADGLDRCGNRSSRNTGSPPGAAPTGHTRLRTHRRRPSAGPFVPDGAPEQGRPGAPPTGTARGPAACTFGRLTARTGNTPGAGGVQKAPGARRDRKAGTVQRSATPLPLHRDREGAGSRWSRGRPALSGVTTSGGPLPSDGRNGHQPPASTIGKRSTRGPRAASAHDGAR